MIYLRFIGGVFSSIPLIYKCQRKSFIITIINVFVRIVALIIGVILDDIIVGLVFFSLFSSIVVLYRLNWFYIILKENNSNTLRNKSSFS
jgi:hypothetical protein